MTMMIMVVIYVAGIDYRTLDNYSYIWYKQNDSKNLYPNHTFTTTSQEYNNNQLR